MENLVKVGEDGDLFLLLGAALKRADEIATGAIGTEKHQLLMIPGRLVQGFRNGVFLGQLAEELETLRKKGSIREGFSRSEISKACFQELLAALEEPPVDEAKFRVLKEIFLGVATNWDAADASIKPALLMNIARRLTTGELVVLASTWSLSKKPDVVQQVSSSLSRWLRAVADHSGLGSNSLVEFHEHGLMEKNLLTPRVHSDRSGIRGGDGFRLTDLGIDICSLISTE